MAVAEDLDYSWTMTILGHGKRSIALPGGLFCLSIMLTHPDRLGRWISFGYSDDICVVLPVLQHHNRRDELRAVLGCFAHSLLPPIRTCGVDSLR